MIDVFISYKREDRAAVERLVRLLEAERIDVWWDPSIVPGEPQHVAVRREDEFDAVFVAGGGERVE